TLVHPQKGHRPFRLSRTSVARIASTVSTQVATTTQGSRRWRGGLERGGSRREITRGRGASMARSMLAAGRGRYTCVTSRSLSSRGGYVRGRTAVLPGGCPSASQSPCHRPLAVAGWWLSVYVGRAPERPIPPF